jgi:hypothetical protein
MFGFPLPTPEFAGAQREYAWRFSGDKWNYRVFSVVFLRCEVARKI